MDNPFTQKNDVTLISPEDFWKSNTTTIEDGNATKAVPKEDIVNPPTLTPDLNSDNEVHSKDSYNESKFLKRENIANGNYNVIPCMYPRMSYFFPGLGRGIYLNISAESKYGKTQFASNFIIFLPLLEAYRNPKLKLRFLYINREESEERIKDRIVCFLLYKYTNGAVRLSYLDLNSTAMPLSKEVCDILESDDFIDLRDFFFSHIQFRDMAYPTATAIEVDKFIKANGTVTYGESFPITNSMTGEVTMNRTIKGYEQNDPEEFLVVFDDNLNNVTPEKGQTLLQAITAVSKNYKDVRNKYNISIVVLQQQNAENDSNDAFNAKRVEPKITTLADCKQVARDINLSIGIFAPSMKFKDLPDDDERKRAYKKYDIKRLGNYFRAIIFMVNRDGESDKTFPFYFDGVTCVWEELPVWDDTIGLKTYYDRIDAIHKAEAEDKKVKDKFKQEMFGQKVSYMQVSKIVKSNNNVSNSIAEVIKKSYFCNLLRKFFK